MSIEVESPRASWLAGRQGLDILGPKLVAVILYGCGTTIIMQTPVGREVMVIVAVLATLCIVAADAAPTPVPITIIDSAGDLVDLSKARIVAIHDIGNRTYAVVSGYGGEHIVDITHPADPLHVSAITYHSSGFDPHGTIEDIAIHDIGNGTYAFVTTYFEDFCEIGCGGNRGYIHIIDITHPTSPAQVAHVHTGYTAQDVAVHDIGNRTYAVVSVGSDMKIMDVTHPADPLLVNDKVSIYWASDITIHDISGRTYAFTAIHPGVQIIDITHPAEPLTVFDPPPVFYPGDSPGARSTAVHNIGNGTYAVVAVRDGVQIVDVTWPDNPLPVAALTDDVDGFTELDGAFDVAVHDIGNRTYALVASRGDSGVQIIDITRPDNPLPVAALTDDVDGFTDLRQAANIAVHDIGNGTYAVVAGFRGGVQMIDVTYLDPVSTTHIPAATHIPATARTANLRTIGWGEIHDIATHDIGNGTYALAVNWIVSGVQIIDITHPADPLPVAAISDDAGGFTELGGAINIAVHNIGNETYALVASFDDSGVQIIDITWPDNPLPAAAVSDDVGGFTELDGAGGIAVHGTDNGTYALVASFDDSGVQIIDITHPADPLPVAAISDDAGGFTKLEGAANIAVHDIGGRTYAVVVSAVDNGVQIIDITHPAVPLPVAAISDDSDGFTELEGALDIDIHDIGNKTYAVVASREDSGVQIIDITRPDNPLPVAAVSDGSDGFTELGGAVNIAVHDTDNRTYAVVAGYKSVRVIDITNPADPISVAWLEGAQSVAMHNISSKTYALVGYTGSFGGGMQIIDMMELESAWLHP